MDTLVSSYEKQRQKNIEENRKVLQSLGLSGGFLPKRQQVVNPNRGRSSGGANRKQGVKRKRAAEVDERPAQFNTNCEGYWTRRWSKRLEGKEPTDYGNLDFEQEDEDEKPTKRPPRTSENVFGSIPGIPVGTTWAFRLDCSRDGIHRPTVAGMHGNEAEGCYSLALSGGYEDDLDFGLAFTYTGAGGRDLRGTKASPKNLRTAPQSKDQALTRVNLALSRNVENRRPVRVIRGFKLDSPFAPTEGYRYDGLYTVERFWKATGLSGYMVYKFALKRCSGQAPAPWEDDAASSENDDCENGKLSEQELSGIEQEVEQGKAEELEVKGIIEEQSLLPWEQSAESTENDDHVNGDFLGQEVAGKEQKREQDKTEDSGVDTEEQTSSPWEQNGTTENGYKNGGLSEQESIGEQQKAEQGNAEDLEVGKREEISPPRGQSGTTESGYKNGGLSEQESIGEQQKAEQGNAEDLEVGKREEISPPRGQSGTTESGYKNGGLSEQESDGEKQKAEQSNAEDSPPWGQNGTIAGNGGFKDEDLIGSGIYFTSIS